MGNGGVPMTKGILYQVLFLVPTVAGIWAGQEASERAGHRRGLEILEVNDIPRLIAYGEARYRDILATILGGKDVK